MANEDWTEAEVVASVNTYVEMLNRWKAGETFSKASYNNRLRAGGLAKRSKGSIEYRMQNISAVLDGMGIPWLPGYKPARNVGPKVEKQIKNLLKSMMLSGLPTQENPIELDGSVSNLRNRLRSGEPYLPPAGNSQIRKIKINSDVFLRDPKVKAWVLHTANGICEGCGREAPFVSEDGLPFLETHHVKTLSDGGPDTTDNTVALCPNCHRKIHLGQDKESFKVALLGKLKRLTQY